MPNSLTELRLLLHNVANDFEGYKRQESSELRRVETWIKSLASTRPAAGLKRWPFAARSRAPSESSASSVALTLATVCTNAESQVSEGLICKYGGHREEDEECEYPSQSRDILGKRAREKAESSVERPTNVPPPAKKPRLEGGKRRTKYTDPDPPSQETGGTTWKYGGFVDSDDDDEREHHAILLGEKASGSLTIRPITSGGITTIIPPYEPRVERPKLRTKNADSGLPHGNDDWCKKFVPTYKKWLGTRAKPWIVDKDESIAALQVIWRAVYPHIDHVIDANCIVYHMANPRISDWQDSFDTAAIDMFKSYYKDLGFRSKETISDASVLLENNRFMYAETAGETQKEYRGLFRSSFILELIAGHYDSISGAIRIPEFERTFSRDQQKLVKSLVTRLRTLDADSREALEIAVKLDVMRMYPRGALALCIMAVERALGVFAPAGGAYFAHAKYSNIRIEKVQRYSDTIKRKLRPDLMEDIVLKACPFMDPSSNILSISVQVLNDSDDGENSSGHSTDN